MKLCQKKAWKAKSWKSKNRESGIEHHLFNFFAGADQLTVHLRESAKTRVQAFYSSIMGAASVQDARKVIKARVIRRLGIEAARSHGRLILGRLAVMRTEVRAALRRRRATRDTWKRDRWNYYMRGGPRAYVHYIVR